ncbi:metallopeptidase TldD-related protein [Sphingobium sp. HBC34]|uniref:Metallopeptidase TldD-related protein n=1 Tax=Sphingobium cyanobacteriorum TaxID=3063954 RepID=A0ABT8ZNF0_9SPHN|nr:metallopeptidase TldD-related protein [Sphingobium sp. HBC34]MDO7835643.1 metallopeptidase TldD-related protein [Sphingobium sp. HBC34]
MAWFYAAEWPTFAPPLTEGVAGSARSVVGGGIVEGLFLSCQSARKLGLRSTGNADGFYNLRLCSDAAAGDLQAMLRRLDCGLFVTDFLGGSTDPATGTWTRAVRGFWVEGGAVAHAVTDVTLAGSMPVMLQNIRAIGDDVERHDAIRTGSILIDDMQVGGGA